MKTILHIFVKDLKGLSRNLFALIIAIGLCIIPSLYAWFNIYSNWDPYANTASIKVAVVSEDHGYTQTDGNTVNMGNQIIEQLHTNDKIGWLFPDTKDEAMEGLKSGKYYATIIIGDDFSYSLYDFLNNGLNHPAITYYENSKKNAVANKITDTGTSTLQQNINKEFIEVVVQTSLEHLNNLSSEDKDALGTLITDITGIRDNLDSYTTAIDTFVESNNSLSANLQKVYDLIPEVQSTISSSISTANTANSTISSTVDSLNTQLDSTLTTMTAVAEQIQTHLDSAAKKAQTDAPGAAADLEAAASELTALIEQNQNLSDVLDQLKNINGIDPTIIESIKSQLQSVSIITELAQKMIEQSSSLVTDIPALIQAKYELLSPILEDAINKINSIHDIYTDVMTNTIATLKTSINDSLVKITDSLNDATDGLNGIGQILLSTRTMIDSANQSLSETKTIISQVSTRIDQLTGQLSDVNESNAYETLVGLLNADAETYAQFLSEPVTVTTVDVYQAANYGTSVTPFYTTLALWVGAIILVALVKCNVDYDDDEYKKAKPHQKYFGRLILFMLMGQLQALIVVLGDLYLLKISCVHPVMFYLASAIASAVFTLLIYTLTLSFGDVGKALAVVMVVIQIAGSSGTYPIELLPDFFKTVYLYFPFPYAINAMREAVSGLYHSDYAIYLLQLSLFAIGSLLVGLLIRLPFIELNHFFEKRMKDTDMM